MIWTTICFGVGIAFGLAGVFTGGLAFLACGCVWTTLGVLNSFSDDDEEEE